MTLRRLTGLVLTLAIGLLPLVPAEHVHEIEEHGHIATVVHRHMQMHELGHAASAPGAVVDHDDAPVATLMAPFVIPAGVHVAVPVATTTITLIAPAKTVVAATNRISTPLPHGPPRAPSGLRAPPSILRL